MTGLRWIDDRVQLEVYQGADCGLRGSQNRGMVKYSLWYVRVHVGVWQSRGWSMAE